MSKRSPAGSVAGLLAAVIALTLLVAVPRPAPAQDAGEREGQDGGDTAVLTGRVVSALTGGPLENASVSLPEVGIGALTDSTGHFRIVDVPAGRREVKVTLIGFAEASMPIDLEPGHTTRVTLLLDRSVLKMEDISVTVNRPLRPELEGFYDRRKQGFGAFFSPGDIEEIDPQRTVDLLRRVPGVRVIPMGYGQSVVRMERAPANRDCPPAIFVDGQFARHMNVEDIPAEDLVAMEVYRGASEVPGEFRHLTAGACGSIVIWTRLHGDPREDPAGRGG